MNTTAAKTRKAIREAAKVLSDQTGCGCWSARKYICPQCETTTELVLAAAQNAKPAAKPAVSVEDRIRDAYRTLAREKADWVPLRDLRTVLADVDRDAVDEAMRAMQARQDALLIPEENQKTLTAADREAAIYFGGQARHLIVIEKP